MAEARDFRNSSSCGVDRLQLILNLILNHNLNLPRNQLDRLQLNLKLIARKIENERVTVVDLNGMNERRSDGLSSRMNE